MNTRENEKPPESMEPDAMVTELRRLRALVKSFSLLNSSLDLERVLHYTLVTACELLDAEIASIALINDEGTRLEFLESTDPNFDKLKNLSVPLGKGVAGTVALTGKTERVDDIHNDERFYEKIDHALGQTTTAYLCTPLVADDTIIGTVQVMNRRGNLTFESDDEALVEGFARQAALAIQNAKLHQLRLQQKAFDLEMQLCAEIQSNLFPKSVPDPAGYEIYGSSTPAKEVGGDYYTYIRRPDGSVDAVLADVSGKGLPAALIVSDFHTGYHLLSQTDDDLETLFNKLNEHLTDTLVVGRFITVFALRIAADGSSCKYVVAGHPPPFVIRANGESEELERTGPVLGLAPIPFRQGEVQLNPGDLLLAFSDGYSEVQNAAEDLFGEERMMRYVQEHQSAPLQEIHRGLGEAVDRFREDEPLPDDMTILLVRRK